MAEKSSSKVRLDAFVAAVHADPAAPEPTILLSGFVGQGCDEGSLRIYPDPDLSSWYEVAESDVVHSQPLADSPLGGSHLWVRASAKIVPGAPAQAQPAVGAPAPGAETGVFNPFACAARPNTYFPCTRVSCGAAILETRRCEASGRLAAEPPAAQQWFTVHFCAGRAVAATDPVFTDAFGCPTHRVPCATAAALRAEVAPWPTITQAPCHTVWTCMTQACLAGGVRQGNIGFLPTFQGCPETQACAAPTGGSGCSPFPTVGPFWHC